MSDRTGHITRKWTVKRVGRDWFAKAPVHPGSKFMTFGDKTEVFTSHAAALAYAVKQSGQ